jgi:hypothetical protein
VTLALAALHANRAATIGWIRRDLAALQPDFLIRLAGQPAPVPIVQRLRQAALFRLQAVGGTGRSRKTTREVRLEVAAARLARLLHALAHVTADAAETFQLGSRTGLGGCSRRQEQHAEDGRRAGSRQD